MSTTQCFFNQDGRVKQFYCSQSQICCEDDCCTPHNSDFYTHWYFWVAVVVLVIFIVAAIVSGYCRFRQAPPYRLLGTSPGQSPQSSLLSRVWSVDESSSNSVNTPRNFQCVHTSRPFMFPYSQHKTPQREPPSSTCSKQQAAGEVPQLQQPMEQIPGDQLQPTVVIEKVH